MWSLGPESFRQALEPGSLSQQLPEPHMSLEGLCQALGGSLEPVLLMLMLLLQLHVRLSPVLLSLLQPVQSLLRPLWFPAWGQAGVWRSGPQKPFWKGSWWGFRWGYLVQGWARF